MIRQRKQNVVSLPSYQKECREKTKKGRQPNKKLTVELARLVAENVPHLVGLPPQHLLKVPAALLGQLALHLGSATGLIRLANPQIVTCKNIYIIVSTVCH